MPAMTPADPESPLMKSWEAFKLTDEYCNIRKSAATAWLTPAPTGQMMVEHPHLTGAIWAAFLAGFQAAQSIEESK